MAAFPPAMENLREKKKKNSTEINTLIFELTKDVWCFKQLTMLYLALTPFPIQFSFLLSWTNPN